MWAVGSGPVQPVSTRYTAYQATQKIPTPKLKAISGGQIMQHAVKTLP